MRLATPTVGEGEVVRIWRNDCCETLRTARELTANQQEQFIKSLDDPLCPHRYWSILDAECNLVAFGGLTFIQWESRIAEISLIVRPELRNMGVGLSAAELILERGFSRLNLQTIFGECYNVRKESVEFWKKLAAKYNGYQTVLPKRKFWTGKYYDSLYFSIDRDDYEQAKKANRAIH